MTKKIRTRTPLDKIRAFVGLLKDHRLAVKLRTVIACATKEDLDVALALREAKDHGRHQSVTAESLAILVKALARSGNFEQARMIAQKDMHGMDTYWHAEAWIVLARLSGDKDDHREAEKAIHKITDHEHRNQARFDLKSAFKSASEDSGNKELESGFNFDVIDQIVSVLDRLNSFEDAHVVCPKNNSAYLHAQAELILAMFFAESLR